VDKIVPNQANDCVKFCSHIDGLFACTVCIDHYMKIILTDIQVQLASQGTQIRWNKDHQSIFDAGKV